ncbi:MAG: hypothetical protein EHM59_13715 [Betaproteobacteria bacterium]|nr:MAG: hypothetical protein EHM59_13715 [Betaproteobacteria bacterium]
MRKTIVLASLALAAAAIFPMSSTAADSTGRKQVTADELAKTPPSATFEFEGSQFRLIVGGGSGKGVLKYQGKDYPFTAKGASVGGIGGTAVHATGDVHFLKNLADFEGTYTGVSAGATAGKGAGGSQFENGKGVIITVKSRSEGLGLNLGVSGLSIAFAK